MGNLLPKILGWLTIIITLALAPSINTANVAVIAAITTNASSFIGMSVITTFGAPLMILALLFTGGMLAAGKVGDGSVRDMMGVIGAVIVTIVALTMFVSVITYVRLLVNNSTGFAVVIYGIIPIILYLGVIAGAGVITAVKSFSGKKSKKSTKSYM